MGRSILEFNEEVGWHSGIRGVGEVMSNVSEHASELEDRLVALGARNCRLAAGLPSSDIGRHVAAQLTRCSTSPAANYAEARCSESRRDFIHKMKICLKELRETMVWLKLLVTLEIADSSAVQEANQETDELIAIFVTSIATARRNAKRSRA
jgi:four helix bundle protein